MIIPTMLAPIRHDLGAGVAAMGLLAGIFMLGSAAGALAAGAVGRRVGLGTLLVGSAATFSVCTLLAGLAPGYRSLLLTRVGTGIGEGAYCVAMFAYLGRLLPGWRSTVMGLASSIFGLALFSGPALIVWLAAAGGGWRAPNLGLGALSLAAVGLLRIALRADPAGRATPPPASAPAQTPAAGPGLWPAVLLATIVNGFCGFAYIGMFQLYAHVALGLSAMSAAGVFGCYGLGTILGGAPVGQILDRWGRRGGVLLLLALGAGLGSALFGALGTPGPGIEALLSLLYGMVVSGVFTNCFALTQDICGAGEDVGAFGRMLAAHTVAEALSGSAFVLAMGSGFDRASGPLWLYALPYGLSALLVGFAPRRPRPSGHRAVDRTHHDRPVAGA